MTPAGTTSFSRYAARLSWVCPIITTLTIALLMLGGQIFARRTIALTASAALCLLVIGLLLGFVALLGISKQGRRGILAQAIVGIILNGLLLSFLVASLVASRGRPAHQRGSVDAPAVPVGGDNGEWNDGLLFPAAQQGGLGVLAGG